MARLHYIPRTPLLCWVNVGAGVLLFASSAISLSAGALSAPALEVIVAVLAVVLMVMGVLGLARPDLRGR